MSQIWTEVSTAASENRHELVLTGHDVSKRISDSGLDPNVFQLVNLNFLNISDTCLQVLPDDISKLVNLQSLLLYSNKLKTVPQAINKLTKLKLLDISRNEVEKIDADFNLLGHLFSLNLSANKLEKFPNLTVQSKLTVIDLSLNNLDEFPDIFASVHLTEVKLNANKITEIPEKIGQLTILKNFDLADNKVTAIPAELSDITKLKEVNLKGNPISDRRLLKLIDQCRPKQVLDYVKQHGIRKSGDIGEKGKPKGGKKGKGAQQVRKDSQNDENVDGAADDAENFRYKITICKDDSTELTLNPVVRQTEIVKTVRPHILCCVVTGLKFTTETFRKFIQMQTRLHDTVCEKRTASTLATHDLNKIGTKSEENNDIELFYDAKIPQELILKPLGASNEFSGAQLYAKLRAEAEQLRREKKRNVYSGVHRYLYMLEGKAQYPCLLNSEKKVISFPPITNSDISRMSFESTAMFVEATSSTNQDACRKALDQLLFELLSLGVSETPGSIMVHRVRITDVQGNLKAVYPSRADLKYDENQGIKIVRE